MAAALANVDDRDELGRRTSPTPCAGGQYLNQLADGGTAREGRRRTRVRETRGLGRRIRSDRRTAASCSGTSAGTSFRGWRTWETAPGLEMIRTLQDHGVHQGIDVHMECTVVELLDRRRAHRRARSPMTGSGDGFGSSRREGCRAGVRGHRAGLQDHQQQLGIHRGRACARLPRRRRVDGHGVRPVPSHRHGVAAERPGHPRHRGRARRGRGAAQQRRQAVHVRGHPRAVPELRPPPTRKRGGATPRATRRRTALPSC